VPTSDPFQWWLMNRKVYPNLALSIHSAPALSVGIEHLFLRGRILISHLCNHLHAATIQALMCFGDWLHEDLFSNEDLVAFLLDEGNVNKDNGKIFVDDDIFI
ncbi:hypothetical protein EV360DRAFT_58660, partial [Lentinula raphanica]